MFTALPLGGIFGVAGVFNSFGDYTELNLYTIANWAKFCDGSIINDIDSPINGKYTPDLTASAPVGSTSGGTYVASRTVGDGIYAFGEYNPQETISNVEKSLTVKYFMRIK